VVRNLNFDVLPGLTVILGPNGAGKTTLLRALSGQIPMRGEVLFNGDDLPEKPHEIVQAGMALVPEGRQLFPQMTVQENLELGGWLQSAADRQARNQPDIIPAGCHLETAVRKFLKLMLTMANAER
jgi:branched-chain amino acid transport system ATP-binding protein